MKKTSNMEKWQRASVIISVVLSLALLVNTSLTAYITYQDNFKASIYPTSDTGESLDINVHGTIGRPSPLIHYLNNVKDWISSYAVGGVSKTNAQTGIVVDIDGANVGSTASVDYYIEAVPQIGGSAYRFLEGNSTSVTVSGANLDQSNQTTIENHLTAMGLSTTSSHTIDYYVYVKAEATGAISGDTLTSEITYQKFDTVTYQYPTEVSETVYATSGVYINSLAKYTGGSYYISGVYFDYVHRLVWEWEVPSGSSFTSVDLEVYLTAGGGSQTQDLYSCEEWSLTSLGDDPWANQPDNINFLDSVTDSFTSTEWHTYESSALTSYVENNAGGTIYLKHQVNDETSGSYVGWDAIDEAYEPELHVSYMSYDASWYPIGPVSVLSIPVGQLFSGLVLFALAGYALYYASGGESRWR